MVTVLILYVGMVLTLHWHNKPLEGMTCAYRWTRRSVRRELTADDLVWADREARGQNLLREAGCRLPLAFGVARGR